MPSAMPVAHTKNKGETQRCTWCLGHELYVAYHDEEWGVPEHDDQRLFAKLLLDGAQAGLSWLTILKKREGYQRAFDGFDPDRIARYDERKIASLLADPGIVRNRLKVQAFVLNAQAYLRFREAEPSFARFLWQVVDGRPQQNSWRTLAELPVRTPQSDALSKELQHRGFTFVGSTICYAFMQAVGMVNDHLVDCFRYQPITRMAGKRARSD